MIDDMCVCFYVCECALLESWMFVLCCVYCLSSFLLFSTKKKKMIVRHCRIVLKLNDGDFVFYSYKDSTYKRRVLIIFHIMRMGLNRCNPKWHLSLAVPKRNSNCPPGVCVFHMLLNLLCLFYFEFPE